MTRFDVIWYHLTWYGMTSQVHHVMDMHVYHIVLNICEAINVIYTLHMLSNDKCAAHVLSTCSCAHAGRLLLMSPRQIFRLGRVPVQPWTLLSAVAIKVMLVIRLHTSTPGRPSPSVENTPVRAPTSQRTCISLNSQTLA